MFMRACVCVRECVRVRACVRVYVRACMRACVPDKEKEKKNVRSEVLILKRWYLFHLKRNNNKSCYPMA